MGFEHGAPLRTDVEGHPFHHRFDVFVGPQAGDLAPRLHQVLKCACTVAAPCDVSGRRTQGQKMHTNFTAHLTNYVINYVLT